MGFIARYKAKREAQRRQDERLARALRESYAHPNTGLDPASTALLYTTIASADVDRDEDVDGNADDTGRTESSVDDSSQSDTYDYGSSDTSGYSDSVNYDSSSSSYDYGSSSSSSYDSGSSYSSSYDSGSSSSYDSGSSSSFDSGSY